MADLTASGVRYILKASVTFPSGFEISEVADDADPFDSPVVTIGEAAMDINGFLKYRQAPQPIPATLTVSPNTEEDKNLQKLLLRNSVQSGSVGAKDVITLTKVFPDGRQQALMKGRLLSGMFGDSISNTGLKSKPYAFAFSGYSATTGSSD